VYRESIFENRLGICVRLLHSTLTSDTFNGTLAEFVALIGRYVPARSFLMSVSVARIFKQFGRNRMSRKVGRPRKNSVPEIIIPLPEERCINCKSVHRHQDGSVYCKKYCFKVIDSTLPLLNCKHWGRRRGRIPPAATEKEDRAKRVDFSCTI